MNFLENITFRRPRSVSEPNESSESISQTLNCTTNTLPEMSEDEDEKEINILRNEVKNLKSQLESAHKEIKLLNSQISTLEQRNRDLIKENEMSQKDIISSTLNKKKQNIPKMDKIHSTKKTSKGTQSIGNISCTPAAEIPAGTSENGTTEAKPPLPILKHNICMISSETSNRLYTLCQRNNLNNFQLCHYRMPKCGLKQLLNNIDKKVQNFTHFDYCIIYIGEEDFRRTHSYIELVTFIREKLQILTHTNFIICLPTFKYMENKNIMFNSRIDTFNNLIYMDVETYKYAYILDSNLNLPYTYETYNLYGSLNNKGLSIVLSDLQNIVLHLNTANLTLGADCSHKTDTFTGTQLHDNSQFFL